MEKYQHLFAIDTLCAIYKYIQFQQSFMSGFLHSLAAQKNHKPFGERAFVKFRDIKAIFVNVCNTNFVFVNCCQTCNFFLKFWQNCLISGNAAPLISGILLIIHWC